MRTVGKSTESVMVEVDVVDGKVELFAAQAFTEEAIPLTPSEGREVAAAIMLACYEAERR